MTIGPTAQAARDRLLSDQATRPINDQRARLAIEPCTRDRRLHQPRRPAKRRRQAPRDRLVGTER